jgi:hypothetical protein
LTYKDICRVGGLFVGLAVIGSRFGPGKRHPNLKAFMCRNSSHKNNIYVTSLSYKGHLVWSCLIGCSEKRGKVLGHKQDGGRKWLKHGKVRDVKEGGSNFMKFLSAFSKVRVWSFGM